ncbi:MAG: hypothetical protein H6686_09390 [Fibrobacteria bacterium]|nr:hypothetical protein [Fibrobacteria bacterium]
MFRETPRGIASFGAFSVSGSIVPRSRSRPPAAGRILALALVLGSVVSCRFPGTRGDGESGSCRASPSREYVEVEIDARRVCVDGEVVDSFDFDGPGDSLPGFGCGEPCRLFDLGEDIVARERDSSGRIAKPFRVHATESAPMIFLEGVVRGLDRGDTTGNGSLLLDVGNSRSHVLVSRRSPEDSGRLRSILLEGDTTSLFLEGPFDESLLVCRSADAPDLSDRIRSAVGAVATPGVSPWLQVVCLGDRIPVSRLRDILAALDTAQAPPAVQLEVSTRRSGRLHHERLRGLGHGSIDTSISYVDISKYIPPEGVGDSGLRLEGLERVLFRHVTARELAAGREGTVEFTALQYLPRTFDSATKVKRPWFAGEHWEPDDFNSKDFRFPPLVPGHDLVLRQVTYRTFTSKSATTWWALYDNGRRSDIWTYDGGFDFGRIMPNYSLRAVVAGKNGGILLRVEGGVYRNGYSSFKGIELGFEANSTRLALKSVRSAFTYLDRTAVVRTEHFQGDEVVEREAKDPSTHHLRTCRFVDPELDDEWEWNWERLVKEAECITRGRHGVETRRKTSTPSYIEAGWVSDTPAEEKEDLVSRILSSGPGTPSSAPSPR